MQSSLEQNVKKEESKINALAYQLWEQAGRPSGRDKEFWYAAEARLRAPLKATVTPEVVKPSVPGPVRVTLPAPARPQAVRPLGLPGSSTARRNHHAAPRMSTGRTVGSPRN